MLERFERYKSDILDILISEYGSKYSDMIKSKMDSVYFNFSSTPDEEYVYIMKHQDEFSFDERYKAIKNYQNFKEAEEKYRRKIFYVLMKSISDSFDIPVSKLDMQSILTLFFDEDFGEGYIDSYSSKKMALLLGENTPSFVKEGVKKDQKVFFDLICSLGVDIKDITCESVDNFILRRNYLRDKYRECVAKKSSFGEKMYKDMKRKLGLKLDANTLGFMSFVQNSYSGVTEVTYLWYRKFYNFIRVPVYCLKNLGIKGIDVNIIHEIIHKIETNGNAVGISPYGNENIALNETRTQILALKTTTALHESGIFIFDDPDDYIVDGESTYELLFPLAHDFISTYEGFIRECAINNDAEGLIKYFGPRFCEFSNYMELVLYEYLPYYIKEGLNEGIDYYLSKKHLELIDDMKCFSERNGHQYTMS